MNPRLRNFFLAAEDRAAVGFPETPEEVARSLFAYFGYREPAPGAVAARVRRERLLRVTRHGRLLPTRRGRRYLERAVEAYYEGAGMVQGAKSHAFRELCRRRQGLELCQHGTLTGAELAALEEAVVRARPRLLVDLGCGVGEVGNRLARAAGARLVGVERSRSAVLYAARRFAGPGSKAQFYCMRMEDFDAGRTADRRSRPDFILLIDALYWVEDPEAFLSRLLGLLAPGGTLACFLSEYADTQRGPRTLAPKETETGAALHDVARQGSVPGRAASIEAVDFTEGERALWRDTPRQVASLQSRFEAEGRGYLARNLLRETAYLSRAVEKGEGARYLYLLRAGS
ncbi:MAG: class I SAM-dependent methyltransferase [Spirochaetaceae bacterium]